ncbi:hypothetical protein ACELLULO517_27075 [Acidisoma cellulosilytica]|uniref:Uncharacterized protein n=1 Tax=Acidisoma cellulosilyticum TaxID=2802395 RepID=A0A963Z6T6_9PROT|nr:hypothetical protein [Acidisoma cellulosilyticum]MCB8883939.1 hypothetical protein [Acidisoma cellulosilyticum]
MPPTDPADQIAARLKALESGQSLMNQALGLLVDTLQQQTDLLAEIAAAVREEPGQSPIVAAINDLTAAVETMGAGVDVLHEKLDALPAALSAALDDNPLPEGAAEPAGL